MSKYCFIESNCLLDVSEVAVNIQTACSLARRGHDVTLFLVQNGVMSARQGARVEVLTTAMESGVSVLADDYSMRERGIGADQLAPGISSSPLDAVVAGLATGAKTLWN